MGVVVLLLLSLLFSATPAFAEQGFDPKYERDYNIFNPINSVDPKPKQNVWPSSIYYGRQDGPYLGVFGGTGVGGEARGGGGVGSGF